MNGFIFVMRIFFVEKYCCYFCFAGVLLFAMIARASAGESEYSAEDILRLNHYYWDQIHTLDIEFSKEIYDYDNGLLQGSLPTSKWVLTPSRERLKTYGWYIVQPKAGNNHTENNSPRFETYPVDFQRETGKNYLFVRGVFSETDTPQSLVEADEHKLLAGNVDDTVFDSGSTENYFLQCPGNTWLNMRNGFIMRFSKKLNPPDETIASFAKKNRVSRPEFSVNLRQERLWTFKIFPKTPFLENETDDMRYIEVCFNESHGFLLERLSYYCFQKWKNSSEKKLVVDNSFVVSDYFRLETGISFPKEILLLRHTTDEIPENALQQKITLKSVKINEILDDSAFNFRIPPYTRVTHFPPTQKKGELFFIVSIWGQNNKPLVTFTEPGQYENYEKEQYQLYEKGSFPIERSGISIFRIFLIISGIILITVALFLMKFKNENPHRKK